MKRLLVVSLAVLFPFSAFGGSTGHGGPPTMNTNVVNTPNVTVTNSVANPVQTQAVDNIDKLELFTHSNFDLRVTIPDGRSGEGPCLIHVPEGKRLVIEHVSVWANMPAGQKLILARITDTRNFNQYLVSYFQGSYSGGGGRDLFIASQEIKQRVVPGESVCLEAQRDSTEGEATVIWGVSGYLVDYP